MPKLDMVIEHRLTQDEAKRRIEGHLEEIFADSIKDVRETWNDNICNFTFSAMGSPITGQLTVTSLSVKLTADLPLAASLVKGRIEAAIRERAAEILKDETDIEAETPEAGPFFEKTPRSGKLILIFGVAALVLVMFAAVQYRKHRVGQQSSEPATTTEVSTTPNPTSQEKPSAQIPVEAKPTAEAQGPNNPDVADQIGELQKKIDALQKQLARQSPTATGPATQHTATDAGNSVTPIVSGATDHPNAPQSTIAFPPPMSEEGYRKTQARTDDGPTSRSSPILPSSSPEASKKVFELHYPTDGDHNPHIAIVQVVAEAGRIEVRGVIKNSDSAPHVLVLRSASAVDDLRHTGEAHPTLFQSPLAFSGTRINKTTLEPGIEIGFTVSFSNDAAPIRSLQSFILTLNEDGERYDFEKTFADLPIE